MAIICGPVIDTISYVSKLICGHLVKIYDIESMYETIEVMIDNQQIIPGIGNVSVSIIPNFTTRATIRLISKNPAAGTATISFAIETIEVPPPVTEATHYLDIYVKPFSWYSVGGAADRIVGKIADINGTILNLFSSVGISDYKYIGTEILTETDKPGLVTIRLHLRQLSALGFDGTNYYQIKRMAVPLIAYIAAIIASVLVIIIIIGVITGWKFTLAGVIEQITGKQFSKKDVADIIWDKVVPQQLSDCEKNFTNPVDQANCKKSVIAGAADGGTDALGLTGTDSNTLGINNKVDACTAQYQIDGDATKYKACVDAIAKAAGTETKAKTPSEGDITGTLILGAFILGGIYIISKAQGQQKLSAGEVARPVLIERERLRAGGY